MAIQLVNGRWVVVPSGSSGGGGTRQPSSGGQNPIGSIFSGLGSDAQKFFSDIGSGKVQKAASDAPIAGGILTTIGQNLKDIASGKDVSTILHGIPGIGDAAQSYFENFGSELLKYSKSEVATSNKEINAPSFWDRVGSLVNVLTAPLVVKDIIEVPFKAGAKAIGGDLGKEFASPITLALKDLGQNIITGGKQVAAKFGSIDLGKLAEQAKAAKQVFPDLTQEELVSKEGRHVIDWVNKQAQKINLMNGGDIKSTRSDLLQAWSAARNLWGDDIKTISKNLDSYATKLEKSNNVVNTVMAHLGMDDSPLQTLALYTKEYMRKVRTVATLNGKMPPSLVDYLENIKTDLPKGEQSRIMMDKAISTVKSVEKEIGYKLGFGHDSFVFPTTIKNIPETMDQLPEDIGKIIGGDITKFQQFKKTLKSLFDPEIYTDDAKQMLSRAKFRQELITRGLDPQDVFDRVGFLKNKGVDFTFGSANRKAFTDAFGESAQKVMDAYKEAKKLPYELTGLSTVRIAHDIPGASKLVNAVFGLRWKSNPLFQLVKIPTKLYEIGIAAGVPPWSKEASAQVVNYVMNDARPMLERIMSNEMLELQYQSRSKYGDITKEMVGASENKITQMASNFLDSIANADEKMYSKAVFKKLKDLGYDLDKVPMQQQLDYMKNVPVNIIGQADNYAKTLTKYGQGTSPLQNTINTIFFPFLFHAKLAKFALAGVLSYPLAAKSLTVFMENQNKWALSPEGQQWHRASGFAETLIHAVGSAEPVNIPALTGRDETVGQTTARFTTPYNPFSPLLQGIRDYTGAHIPGTEAPRSTGQVLERGNAARTFIETGSQLTGYGSVLSTGSQLSQDVSGKQGFQPNPKNVQKNQQRIQRGQMPDTRSLKTTLRNFVLQQSPSQDQKQAYAEERAQYDFPDDTKKQKQEEDLIMRIFRGIRVKKQRTIQSLSQ